MTTVQMIYTIFALFFAAVWIAVPFVMFKLSLLLRLQIKEQKATNDLLRKSHKKYWGIEL